MAAPGLNDDAGMTLRFQMFSGFIFVRSDNGSCTGVFGGAIMASLGILSSMLGFDENAQALMIALYIAMDSFGTACNVTGDACSGSAHCKWFRIQKTNTSSTFLKTDRNPISYNSATYEKQKVALSLSKDYNYGYNSYFIMP